MMKRRLITWAALLTAGYMAGARGVPAGEEFLVYASVLLVTGFWMGRKYTMMQLQWRERRSESFRLFGFEIRRAKHQPADEPEKPSTQLAEVVELKQARKEQAAATICDLCHGEPVRIAGMKEAIPCPKCSKSAAK